MEMIYLSACGAFVAVAHFDNKLSTASEKFGSLGGGVAHFWHNPFDVAGIELIWIKIVWHSGVLVECSW